jgi:thymidine kinase
MGTTTQETGLELIVGPMFSGKTSELIRRLSLAEAAGSRVVAVKPSFDREPDSLVSLTGSRWPAKPVTNTPELVGLVTEVDVLGIDELQFFRPDVVGVLLDIRQRMRIIAAGLDFDFRGDPFGSVPALVVVADNVSQLNARCERCGEPATRTQRLVAGHPAPRSGPTIQVGGHDLYEPRCERCFVAPS